DSCRIVGSETACLPGAMRGVNSPPLAPKEAAMTDLSDRPRARLTRKQLRERLRAVRRQQARKARASRRQLRRVHERLPEPVDALFAPLAPAFTRPTYHRFLLLALAAILTLGGRTLVNLLRTLRAPAPRPPTDYHRVLSRNRCSPWALARRFTHTVLTRLAPTGPVLLAGDDTVTEHPGPHVYGKGCHRDPVRSTHSFTAYRWGHKWVVLAMLVRFP